MKKNIFFLILILSVSACGCLGEEVVETLTFYSCVEVVNETHPPHIVASKDVLDFGKLPRGMSEKKEILLENNRDYEVKVSCEVNGSISEFISFERDEMVIPPHGSAKQVVYIRIPSDAELGKYTGYVTFIARRV